MQIAILLHFYQPHNQQKDILDRIVNESYRPIIQGLVKRPHAQIIANFNGVLIKLLVDNGYQDVVSDLKILVARNQIEVTSSAMYHTFLPLLPKEEIVRQIEINNQVLKETFGAEFESKGFFSPEMALNKDVLRMIKDMDFSWIPAAQVAFGPNPPATNKFYKDKVTGLYTFFRNKRVSVLILSAAVRDSADLIKETQDAHNDLYWFCVMDAETFGHHRVGHEKLLFDILDNEFFEPVTIKDLLKMNLPVDEVEIRPSTWTNEEQDFWMDRDKTQATTAKSFVLWKDPNNPIHLLQWELTQFVIETVNKYPNKNDSNWQLAREKLDKALASDQYWWASAKPWWSLEMIEQGAYNLKDIVMPLSDQSNEYQTANDLYHKILAQAFEWQRSGYIREKHLQASSTYMKEPFKERTSAEWYNQIILEFEDEMRKAAERTDFEKAIKWRDAMIKLRQGSDIYDVLHVVDELWTARNIPSVKPFFAHTWEEFSDFVKPYMKEFNTKGKFEEAREKSPYKDESKP